MSETMKILQILAPGQVEWCEAPVPVPAAGEVLVRVEAVTTCPHWDLHLMSGEPMFAGGTLEYPYTAGQPGHEAMGKVIAVGPGVTTLTPGTRVAAWRDQGHHRPGAYARYATFLEDNLLPLPSGLTSERVTSLELAMCVQVSFDQMGQLGAVKGKRFGVSGLGPAGLVAVQLARACGAREVVALDPLPARRELARSLGADVVLDPTGDDLPSGRGATTALDAALDCTGLKASIEYLMDRTRQAVAIFGVLRETVGFGPGHWPGLALLGYLAHNRAAAEKALAQIVAGRLDLACLSTHSLPLSRYAEGVELLRSKQAIKVRFLPWSE